LSCCGRRVLLTHPAQGALCAHCNGGNRAVCVEQVRRQYVDRRRIFIFNKPRHRLHASGGNYRRRRCRQRKLRRMQHVASFCSLSHHGATCARRWTWNNRVHIRTPWSRRCTWHQSSSAPLWVICAQTEAQGSVWASWVVVGEGYICTLREAVVQPYMLSDMWWQVGASDSADIRSSFSNWGSCLDLYASL